MLKIVGIIFNKKSRVYNFNAMNFSLKEGDKVIVETERGLQYGCVKNPIVEVKEQNFKYELKPIIRLATSKDEHVYKKNVEDAQKALINAKKISEDLSLDMYFQDASFTFDRKQLLLTYLADDRVDFRELAKRLAGIYRTRIELRQIGVRDKAKEIGGLGPCGRMLCCNTFLSDLNGVTINMAKNQMLALNPTKINGSCGRLLCCLSYEDELYTELRSNLPDIGSIYQKEGINGKVINIDILRQKFYVQDQEENIHEVML